MKITEVEIVHALQWPFVRIHTDAGISGIGGIGEASLQQKELAVRTEVEAYRDYLIGQNPFNIELIRGLSLPQFVAVQRRLESTAL